MLFQWLVHYISIGISSIPQSPRAYIDPNTGGMLFQILAVIFAVFSGFLFFFSRQIKSSFARMKRFLRRSDEPIDEPIEEPVNEPVNEEKPK
jgi:hypothetical protein